MGSWNGTCGVSQLPIMYRDNVAIFFMKKKKRRRVSHVGCVYSDDLYEPVSPAIFGKYNDYGRVVEVQADSRILESLFDNHADYEDIGELIDKETKKQEMYIMLVHLELYKNILSNFGEKKEFFTEGMSVEEHTKKELISFISEKKEGTFNEYSPKYWILMDSLGFQRRFYQREEIYADILTEDPLIDSLVELSVFKHAMSLSRKLWVPQAGQGSQDYEFDMVNITGQFAIKKEKEDEEYY